MKQTAVAATLTLMLASSAHGQIADWVKPLEASNMRIVGDSDLNGKGNGGEGLALDGVSQHLSAAGHWRAALTTG